MAIAPRAPTPARSSSGPKPAQGVALMCPVCRDPVDPRRAFLDDGGAYHRACGETGPTCALCGRSIAPGSAKTHAGDVAFHTRCYQLLLAGAGQ